MEEENYQPLLLPITTPSTITTAIHGCHDNELRNPKHISSSSNIVCRLVFLFFIGSISVWANYEASKGFTISIVNESRYTISGNRFQLFYVSNDEATRILMKTSKIVENFLYPDTDHSHSKKHVNHVIIRLGNQNATHNVNFDFSIGHGQFVVNVNPSIMVGKNFRSDMLVALQRGVARMWMWDGKGRAPENLINGIVEYIVCHELGGVDRLSIRDRGGKLDRTTYVDPCWKREDFRKVADFLDYCERGREGFIRRLNEAMKDEWNDSRLDIALGHSIGKLCTTYYSLHHNISAI